MLVNELKNKLDQISVSQDLYSIMTGGLPNERYNFDFLTLTEG